MDVPTELRSARQRAGLTQAELARRAGTSQATLSAYEGGRKTPSLNTLHRLLAGTGSRLVVQGGEAQLVVPSERRHERTALTLGQVLELAAALPIRHQPRLSFPRLPVSPG